MSDRLQGPYSHEAVANNRLRLIQKDPSLRAKRQPRGGLWAQPAHNGAAHRRGAECLSNLSLRIAFLPAIGLLSSNISPQG